MNIGRNNGRLHFKLRGLDPALVRALDVEWRRVFPRLLAVARRLSTTPDEARELTHDTYIALRERPWDRDRAPDLFQHARRLMGSCAARRRRFWSEIPCGDFVQRAASSERNPEELLLMKEDDILAILED